MMDLFTDDPALHPRCSLIPRDYQQQAIEATFRLWDGGHVGAMCRLPTGTGKSLVAAMIADLWLQRSDEHRVLVLEHERQLIQQMAQEFEDVLHIRPAIEMADIHCRGDEKIIVASRQTLYVKGQGEEEVSRLFKFRLNRHWLVIIDEAHRYTRHMHSCKQIIKWFESNPTHRRLGLTATPERMDKIAFTGLFSGVASDYALAQAMHDGWLVPYDQRYVVVDGVDFKNIKEVAKDFDQNELERILGEQSVLASICKPMLDLVGRRRTLIFSPTTAMAKNVALYINAELGHEAAKHLDGSCPDLVRKATYKQYSQGAFQFLSVCGLCKEGFNNVGIGAVAIFRPTKSRSLKEQMIGRGCRPLSGVVSSEMTADERRAAIAASEKDSCLIVDLVGCTGLGDVPSVVDILADGLPDEVRERANKKLLATPNEERGDVAKSIREADTEIKEEQRLARETRNRLEQEEADRRAKLKAEVKYTQRKVKSGQAGKSHRKQRNAYPPTHRMCNYLYALGVKNPEAMSMNQARGFMNQVSKKHGQEYIVRGGPLRGKALKDIPHPELKALAVSRNSGSNYDNEFQSEVALYREQWKAARKPKGDFQ